MNNFILTEEQLDVVQEIINIGIGQAANLLNTLSSKHVYLEVPEIRLLTPSQLVEAYVERGVEKDNFSSVSLEFSGLLVGSAKLVFPTEQASKLVLSFTDTYPDLADFDEIQAETLSEIGNIVLNSLVGSISNILEINLNYSIPNYITGTMDQILSTDSVLKEDCVILFAKARFKIQEIEVVGEFILIVTVDSAREFVQRIDIFIQKGGFFKD